MYPKSSFPWQRFIRNRWTILSILLGLGWFVYYMSVNYRSSSTCCKTNKFSASEFPSINGQRIPKEYYRSSTCCKTNESSASEFPSMTGQRIPKEYFEDLSVCSAIIQGDMVGKNDEIAQLLGYKETSGSTWERKKGKNLTD